jgi:hypothetical protein
VGAVDDVDELIEQFNLAQEEFVKGNPEPMSNLFSHREDVSLNNPLSPPAHGWSRLLRLWSVPHRSSEVAR